MPKLLTIVNTFNRWYTLGVLLEYLKYTSYPYPIFILDGGSTDRESLEYFSGVNFPKYHMPKNEYTGNYSCGNTRKYCIDLCLSEFKDYDYFFIVDDDILFNQKTVDKSFVEFDFLNSKGLSLGSYSPFTFLLEGNVLAYGDIKYRRLDRGGEAHVLLKRDILEEVGNNFGPFYKGFGDIHWVKQLEKGYNHVAKFTPVDNIQHIGILDGVALKRAYTPKWTFDFYVDPGTGKRISLDGFDVEKFRKSFNECGCNSSCIKAIGGEFFI